MKKLLVWDADWTLWKGTLMEGDKVELFPGRAELVHELMRRGVLQAVASHNLEKDIRAKLHEFGLDDAIISVQADLVRPKSQKIRGAMEELNIARTEDVVFIDDLMSNLSEASNALRGLTIQMPGGLEDIVEKHFTKETYTEEDRLRVRRAAQELVRKRSEVGFSGSHLEFLQSCQIEVEIRVADATVAGRVEDLVKRAHKMAALDSGTTTEDILAALGRGEIYALSASDRFGDYGLTGVMWVLGNKIRALVISCRLQGKGIGSAFLGWALQRIQRRFSTAQAAWVENEYNGGMRDLFSWYEFEIVPAPGGTGLQLAYKRLDSIKPLPTWITIAERRDKYEPEAAPRRNTR